MKFYQDIVGLPVNRRFSAGPTCEIAFLGDGETKVELICNTGSAIPNIGQDISLGFEADSLEDKLKSARDNGVEIESGPVQPNPHVKFFFVKDPNGVRIQFVQNI